MPRYHHRDLYRGGIADLVLARCMFGGHMMFIEMMLQSLLLYGGGCICQAMTLNRQLILKILNLFVRSLHFIWIDADLTHRLCLQILHPHAPIVASLTNTTSLSNVQ